MMSKTKEELDEMYTVVQWELESMDYASLQEFFINTVGDFYLNDEVVYQDMLSNYKEYTDTEIVLGEDTELLSTFKASLLEDDDE